METLIKQWRISDKRLDWSSKQRNERCLWSTMKSEKKQNRIIQLEDHYSNTGSDFNPVERNKRNVSKEQSRRRRRKKILKRNQNNNYVSVICLFLFLLFSFLRNWSHFLNLTRQFQRDMDHNTIKLMIIHKGLYRMDDVEQERNVATRQFRGLQSKDLRMTQLRVTKDQLSRQGSSDRNCCYFLHGNRWKKQNIPNEVFCLSHGCKNGKLFNVIIFFCFLERKGGLWIITLRRIIPRWKFL